MLCQYVFRRCIRRSDTKAVFSVEYQDKESSSNWHPGQLTYYKTDLKVSKKLMLLASSDINTFLLFRLYYLEPKM